MAWYSAALMLGVLAAVPAAFAAECDLDAVRNFPTSEVLAGEAIPVDFHSIFFKAPMEETRIELSDRADEKLYRQSFRRALASLDPAERNILALAAFSKWVSGRDGLLTFFVLDSGVVVEEVLEVLDAEGLTEHAALVREGVRHFGPRYGLQGERYVRWLGDADHSPDVTLEAALLDVSERFRALPDPMDIAVERIAADSGLAARYQALRQETDPADRLAFLGGHLWACLDHYGTPEDVARRLDALPDPYDDVIVAYVFNSEMLNGSVHQFFFNSSGVLATAVADAFDTMELAPHAQAVRDGIAMFPDPYPLDTEERRRFMARQDERFDEALYALIGPVDDGRIVEAMIRVAEEAGILPR